MAKEGVSHSAMARARKNDGISVIFDQRSPASSHSESRSRSRSWSSGAVSSRGRRSSRRNYRSPSSSTSSSRSSSRSRSRSHNRSRSHPRCHRASSRCGCRRHRGYRYEHRRSPTRRYRDHSSSCSPSVERYSHHRSSTSRPKYSSHRRYRDTRVERTHRSRSRSMSAGRSVSLSVENKRDLLLAAKANAKKLLGVEKLPLPESVKPILPEQPDQSDEESSVFEKRVRRDSEKSLSQSGDEHAPSPVTSSPHRKTISFSINNSFAKPTVLSQTSVKVAVPADTYDSSKPYGLWVPVQSSRKHKHAKSH
ncbi:arginine/serine-rich protein 1 isoform X1 [Synchiropus splendidus]|uniref:arginine/serine-rich protein 1 isoform X1 n=1 Tax=Synchiropus splendidus TaxID=270530 RepID=UPI00237EA9C6|nr:arginine/serine-rich protein 1 isoform X1 [Synchiropus splendidus]